mgnify:CR=1 FL=1
MREIKFRGKAKYKTQEFNKGEWVYGYYFYTKIQDEHYIYAPLCNQDGSVGIIAQVEVIPETVGQYIGLKDKEGNEIYEEDILAIEDQHTNVILGDGTGPTEKFNHIVEVYYDMGQYVVDTKTNGNFIPETDALPLYTIIKDLVGKENIEIIGNKYENQELLEG